MPEAIVTPTTPTPIARRRPARPIGATAEIRGSAEPRPGVSTPRPRIDTNSSEEMAPMSGNVSNTGSGKPASKIDALKPFMTFPEEAEILPFSDRRKKETARARRPGPTRA